MGKSNKDRSKQKRTFDPDGYRRRADAIIFRDKSFHEVLLVSSRSEPEMWTVPGGGVEPCESGAVTAVREASEEAGVIATVDSFAGSFDDVERKTRTEVYLVVAERMVDAWEDQDEMGRRRRWFSITDAISQTARRPLKQHYLMAACKLADIRRHQVTTPTPQSPPTGTLSSSHRHQSPLYTLALTFVLIFCISAYYFFV